MSLRKSTLCWMAKRCVSGAKLSTETRMPAVLSAAIAGSSRRISSAGGTRFAAILLAAAPRSTTSAPSATSRRAAAIAAAGSRWRPPSENESSVMLTMPNRIGGAIKLSSRPVTLEHHPHPLGVGKNVELLDRDPDMRDPWVGEAGSGDAFGKAFAQIDVLGGGDRAKRSHHLFVIDDAAAIVAGVGRALGGGQLDRDSHALRAILFLGTDADAAHHDEIAHGDGVALSGWRALHRKSPCPTRP